MLAIPALLAGACAAEDPGQADADCSDGSCDELDKPDSEIPDSPCDGKLVDKSGRRNQKVAGRLNDPLAQKAFRAGTDCPTSFQAIMAKLRQTDADGCAGPRDGIATRGVSETAQASGAPTEYRLVTTRTCGNRPKQGILFSLFGVKAGTTSLPSSVEIIAFDEAAGVFNYYEADGTGINFFGNSKDLLKGAAGEERRCAGCHSGGGLIMKELQTPWLHWEGHKDSPGLKELIEANQDLGTRASGAEFEGLVRSANQRWNQARIDHVLANGSIKDLLRPLFCAVEVNLDNGADFESPVAGGRGGTEISQIPFDSLLDPKLAGFGGVPINFTDYDAQIKANGQIVRGVSGAIDTVFDYAYPERAEADDDYVQKLIERKIVDQEFVKDVLLVDFTRPLFSPERCALLDKIPELGKGEPRSPDAVRAHLANLKTVLSGAAPGSYEAVLLANLEATGGHEQVVQAFTKACTDLGSQKFVANALAITSMNRKIADARPVFEFPATMPTDNQNVPQGTRLHPKTCELTTDLVNPLAP